MRRHLKIQGSIIKQLILHFVISVSVSAIIIVDLCGCCFAVFFFWRGRRGTRTPKHFVNLTGESKNFKMLEFPLNQLQMYYGYLCVC
jgi:hypothetical protein